jgi:hypothetical protein
MAAVPGSTRTTVAFVRECSPPPLFTLDQHRTIDIGAIARYWQGELASRQVPFLSAYLLRFSVNLIGYGW